MGRTALIAGVRFRLAIQTSIDYPHICSVQCVRRVGLTLGRD